jgi:hypothetical protein
MSINRSGESSHSYKDGLRGKKEHTCDWCGDIFLRKVTAIKGENKFCTKKCYGEWSSIIKTGKLHSQWKGGVTFEQRLARTKKSYIRWRSKVFELDNYTCVLCGSYGGKLNAHHDFSFSEFLDLRECINNGVTVCTGCHKWIHRKKKEA